VILYDYVRILFASLPHPLLPLQLFSGVCVSDPVVVTEVLRDHCASVGKVDTTGDELEGARERERARMDKCLEMLQVRRSIIFIANGRSRR